MTEPIRPAHANDRNRRRRRGGWLWWLLLLVALLIALIIVLAARGCGDDDDSATSGGNSTTATSTNTGSGSAGATTDDNGSSSGSGGATTDEGSSAGAGGTLTSSSSSLLGLTPTGVARFVGKPAAAHEVKVVSVVGDEVFWVGSSKSDRVLVHLRTSGSESPPKVRAGDRASFTGAVAKNAAGAAGTYGVTEREGAALLKRQGVHIETAVSTLKLDR
jgi:hypothetical protein